MKHRNAIRGRLNDLKSQVDAIEAKIEPLQEIVDATLQAVDFQAPAEWLAEGMNA